MRENCEIFQSNTGNGIALMEAVLTRNGGQKRGTQLHDLFLRMIKQGHGK